MNPYDKIADELEQHPERWTQRVFALNKDRYTVEPGDPDAVTWCAAGLCARDKLSCMPLEITADGPVWRYNDAPERTVADIIQLFRDAGRLTP